MPKDKKSDNAGKKPAAKESPAAESTPRKGHPFLLGLLLGLIAGVAAGWFFRPPESFAIEDLRRASEKRFLEAKDQSRQALAEYAEQLANKLRSE